jgi:predicted ATPase
MPGAQILELTESGIDERSWEDLEMVRLWRSFLSRPDRFFEAEG